MKTIKDAVIELGGVWRDKKGYLAKEDDLLLREFGILIVGNSIFDGDRYFICTKSEFESEAKRLGYINGYRWGVEYPTNGKRPELPDDVICDVLDEVCSWCNDENEGNVGTWKWFSVKAFRITDPRYKPADTSYLNALSQAQSLTHGEEGLAHSEWWDYENDKALKLPPAGVEVVGFIGSNFKEFKCHFVGLNSRGSLVIEKEDGELKQYHKHQINLKPIDHATRKAKLEREKVIEAAVQVCTGVKIAKVSDGLTMNTLNKLYDAGMLVLTPKKSDTED